MFLLRLFLLCLSLFGTSAFALVPLTGQWSGGAGSYTCIASDPLSAMVCGITKSNPSGQYTQCRITAQSATSATGVCRFNNQFDVDMGASLVGSSCPANSTPSGGQCVCQSGFSESGGQCVNADQVCQAKSGTSEIVNVTSGWQRTPSVGSGEDWLYPLRLNSAGTGSVCNGGCTQNFDLHEPCPDCGAYVSQVPSSQGLYRVSTDFMGHYSGASCTAGALDARITADDSKDPPCPGYVGEVNGVKGCYGTAEKPIRPETPDPAVDKNPKDKGNPEAGTKPTSGEGSGNGGAGRTPSNGTGGSRGGPAGAAGSGNKPDGKTDKPEDGKEQANCGAPGQPKCGIEEAGTPGTFTPNDGLDAYKEKMDTQRGQIAESGSSTFGGFNVFFSAPPFAGCTPFELPSDQGVIDPCEVVDGVRAVMAYIWALAALWLCLGWIREAV